MASGLPLRLLACDAGVLSVIDPLISEVSHFDIVSYTWGKTIDEYNCGIPGVDWPVTINPQKIRDIQRLMINAKIQYLWVDCLCLNQVDATEKAFEISKMYEYYKRADTCHILLNMPQVWDPLEIVDNLKFISHVLDNTSEGTVATEATKLTQKMIDLLEDWQTETKHEWTFPVSMRTAKSSGINRGVLNCYSTSISHVRSVFQNLYFTRVWTFQEMVLGKNITMWGISEESIAHIGDLSTWIDLATDSKDKAQGIEKWISDGHFLNTAAVNAVLRALEEDLLSLSSLQLLVLGINSARTDVINGGPHWWHDNYRGISNIFSAISISPRECQDKRDVFRGLLGIFSGLFTPDEIKREMEGDDMDRIAFAFFKQLSIKTGRSWTRLAITSRARGQWDWIPVVEDYGGLTTDYFAGVVDLGRLGKGGDAKSQALTKVNGLPRKYMTIKLIENQHQEGFYFTFKGCNCGRQLKTGTFRSELIPTNDQPWEVPTDEIGKTLVQCATVLGFIMDPAHSVVEYRRRLLEKLQPYWRPTDDIAKPKDWIQRCVSGTPWENPFIRVHNWSMNLRMPGIEDCQSRLENDTTRQIACRVVVDCGCTITAPSSLIFEAISAVQGSSLGGTAASLDDDGRITIRDGLGLVQIGDIGRTFKLAAFGGDVNAHSSYAYACRKTREERPVIAKAVWPFGRVLVRDEFEHSLKHLLRKYGYVRTGGCGNLLICRDFPLRRYRIIGVCIDENIPSERQGEVIIR